LKNIILLLSLLAIIPITHVWAITDLSTLGSPDVSISSNMGSPGSKITITVSHIPDISKTSYPYPDLYIYLPFSQPFGTAISSHCGGEDCFPIYTHDDSLNQGLASRVITFSLPSTSNPKPTFLNGFENTVCDVIINGKTVERFSTLCNTKDEPQGTYQIKIGWVLETDLEQKYIVKTIPYRVTGGAFQSPSPVADNGDIILKEYQNGTISQAQFYQDLKSRGWTDEQIRQALAVIGKLPHQMGIPGPDYGLPINQTTSPVHNTTLTNMTVQEPAQPIPKQVTKTVTNNNTENNAIVPNKTNFTNSSLPIQQNSTDKTNINPINTPARNDFMWNEIIIGLSTAAAAIMAGVVIFVKTHRSK
jgi:hypothetical protein